MQKLSERQKKVLAFIEEFINRHGYSPTCEEIREQFRFRSPNAVTCYLRCLEKKGYLFRKSRKARAISLKSIHSFFRGIPVLGKIAAGVPILPEDFSEETLLISPEITGGGEIFALKVKGDSMEQAGIFDGDYVLVRRGGVEDGDIVAAVVGDEATVKILKKDAGNIFLVSANPTYKPIRIKERFIAGKVVGLFRKFS
jgi:repressor LexA